MATVNTADNNNAARICALLVQGEQHMPEALALAGHLGISIISDTDAVNGQDAFLRLDDEGLVLLSGNMQVKGDFTHLLPRIAQGKLQGELLVRAARKKGAQQCGTAVDATAGLGEDAFLLAAAGFTVRLYERDAVIAALLADALRRAALNPELAAVTRRMQLFEEDSIDALRELSTPPDVILLDPMFPSRQKSSLVKKKFQLLHILETPCQDERELLDAAAAAHPQKIIIKRPVKGPYLAQVKPAYSLTGKTVRYDCIVFTQ